MHNRSTGSNAGSDRGHGKENPRRLYAVSRRAQPAPVVRGRSRRIKTLRFRPAHIRLINRRLHRLDHYPRCFPRGPTKTQTRFSKIDKVVPYQRRNLLRLKAADLNSRSVKNEAAFYLGRFGNSIYLIGVPSRVAGLFAYPGTLIRWYPNRFKIHAARCSSLASATSKPKASASRSMVEKRKQT
jgi:hypothetical protein